MSLSAAVAQHFSAQVRARGEAYHRAGAVELLLVSHARIEAWVYGTDQYDVTIERKGRRISMSCTCPYADDYSGGCKHLWAVIRASEVEEELTGPGAGTASASVARRTAPPKPPAWRRVLTQLRQQQELLGPRSSAPAAWPPRRQVVYILDALDHFSRLGDGVLIELATQPVSAAGPPGALKRFAQTREQWLAVPDEADREIAQLLAGASEEAGESGYRYGGARRTPRTFRITPAATEPILRRMCDTGRARIRLDFHDKSPPPLAWDAEGEWELRLQPAPADGSRCELRGTLVRGDREMSVNDPVMLLAGLVVTRGADAYRAAPLRSFGSEGLAHALRDGIVLDAPSADAVALIAEVSAAFPALPPIEMPKWLGVDAVRAVPTPLVRLAETENSYWQPKRMSAELGFDYDGTVVESAAEGATVASADSSRLILRDPTAEAAALARLEAAGFKRQYDYGRQQPVLQLGVGKAMRAAAELSAEGWKVEIAGQAMRQGSSMAVGIRSGIDWFDVEVAADFDGVSAAVPELLAALQRGDRTVTLADGSLGMLPDDWAARLEPLMAFGKAAAGGVRFARGQAALLDALLAAAPGVRVDEVFERARAELPRFEGVVPLDPPPGFTGALREYQRHGLGWLESLRRIGFGGVLADDMGLGKTVQVLALLALRRQAGAGPSLVVVPRSVMFNWQEEAARFTPELRVAVRHGAGRRALALESRDCDIVLTTYGTLRADVEELREIEFDHVILDEAQAIKNAATATAKAARLLRARHRLAMSGTPIENRLAELWSLFEFLNPGLLGAAKPFQRAVRQTADASEQAASASPAREAIARTVRPFILRRTKAQVARDLPAREEQTLWVDLDRAERRSYDELRDHYRDAVLGRIASGGLARARIHVLEALLRLRQAACHPGLIDKARVGEPGSKLEVLLARVTEAVSGGHKTLVFSQFTSFLAIVRARLDAAGIAYEYLDGKTRDRKARVDRFQNDPAVPLFLISLKAGGLGLNLTAAEYVFLLDPWWNPAVEAQAIDRAHRIGQTKPVLAVRLVARDTIEEKVLALQDGKRELADAIIRAEDGPLASLTREEIERLLE